jgi:cell division protein FtsQ
VYQPESKEQLQQRRQQLRQQRRIRVITSLWRFTCTLGIVAGLGWAIGQPDWTISKPEQVRIEGNQYLSDATVRSMLAIPYPKLIMELAPAQLATQLVERSAVANVKIDRGVLPPHLVVQIQDFPPVARIMQTQTTHAQIFIDERGLQLPISSYRPTVWRSLPTLQLRLSTQGNCDRWPQLYQAVRTSPVAIGIVDCRNPQNLILQTELGKVGLGAIGDKSKLNHQMQQLDRLRNWQKHTLPEDVELLDLENPDSPRFQLKRSTPAPSPSGVPPI